jgi:transcriptional regulator with XRE-family HTH domain
MSYLGENIKWFRKKKGLTIKELSELCNSGVSSISQIETGKRDATFKLILKIAQALEIDVSELVSSPEKIKYKHHIDMAIKFSDFTIAIGTSRRSSSEFYKWGAVFDLSNEKIIDVLHFYPDMNKIHSNDFFENILLPYISDQRLYLLMNSIDISNTYNEMREKGMKWNDFKILLAEFHKKLTIINIRNYQDH